MKKAPAIWKLNDLVGYAMSGHHHAQVKPGLWVPARPLGLDSIKNRLKCAWLVFTGKCDVVEWKEQ